MMQKRVAKMFAPSRWHPIQRRRFIRLALLPHVSYTAEMAAFLGHTLLPWQRHLAESKSLVHAGMTINEVREIAGLRLLEPGELTAAGLTGDALFEDVETVRKRHGS